MVVEITLFVFWCFFNDISAKIVHPPKITLSNGVDMPSIGISTWTGFSSQILSPSDIKPTSPALADTLQRAIDYGYRLFDAASCEGENEKILGSVIASRLADNYLSRRDFFISTKLSSYSHKQYQVVPELQEALLRLNLEYVDLYLMHLPFALLFANKVDDSIDYTETWRGMIDALDLNLTRSVGVAHVDMCMLETLVRSGVKPHVLQIEVNLNLQQSELLDFCSLHNITVLAVNPHGSLYSTEHDVSKAPLPRWDDPVLAGFGNKYGKTVPQIALRFLVQKGVIPLICPHSRYQMQESRDIFDFELAAFENFLLKSFNNGFRTLDFKYWSYSKYYPFKGDQAVEARESMYPGYYGVKFPRPNYNVTEKTTTLPLNDL